MLLGAAAVGVLADDRQTQLTTYLPFPHEAYNELRTSGNVQIGQLDLALNAARLYIAGNIGSPSVRVDTNGQTRLVVTQTNLVGIGTTAPSAPLDVRGAARTGGVDLKVDNALTDEAFQCTDCVGQTGGVLDIAQATVQTRLQSCPAGQVMQQLCWNGSVCCVPIGGQMCTWTAICPAGP